MFVCLYMPCDWLATNLLPEVSWVRLQLTREPNEDKQQYSKWLDRF